MSDLPPKRTGLSLYANLLEPENSASTTATAASAPASADTKKKLSDSALRFQPIRRAAPTKQKQQKPPFPKPSPATPSNPDQPPPPPSSFASALSAPAAAPTKSRLADWAPTEEDEWLYGTGEKRQRGGRRNKKRRETEQRETDWDDMYDPARPTNVDEYMHSPARMHDVRVWKDVLYAHRAGADGGFSEDDGVTDDARYDVRGISPPRSPPAARLVPQDISDDASGDAVYARRLAMSQNPPASTPAGVVASSAPLLYAQPDSGSQDKPSSVAPAQQGPSFGNRIMSKYGWTRGSGLGAASDGITSALAVKVDKRRKRPDAEGGGWAEPERVMITGGKRKDGGSGRYGKMSEVVVLRGMLEGMQDLAAEIEAGLSQEIGEECGDKYGRVDRVYIHQPSRQVFIKFTDQISALRAVSELDGRIFNGNTIRPAYFDPDQFDAGKFT
ncbi:hypothetical protein TD95_001052 [Thielaviopsis punctulata]|uniref:G-patch domain-containing protein n=1 Tax=Thielaviopsis punctulata TaxID=72032 RepID=A0A0F4Z8U0_9PEZI|nr:hypothetical protein TD95_001052 [Thielaviopsis punctulata]